MSWNDGYERKKFNARIKKEIAEYKAVGMTEEQITAIVSLDEDQYRSERRYHMHTQEFCESDFDDDDGGYNGKSPLYKKYMEQLTVTIDSEKDTSNRYSWRDEIDNRALSIKLSGLKSDDIELITLYVFDGLTHREIAERYGCSEQNIQKKFQRIKKFLS